jgi:hypothetical protein
MGPGRGDRIGRKTEISAKTLLVSLEIPINPDFAATFYLGGEPEPYNPG